MRWIKTFEAQTNPEKLNLEIEEFFDFDKDWIEAVLVELEDLGVEKEDLTMSWVNEFKGMNTEIPFITETKPVIKIDLNFKIEDYTKEEQEEINKAINRTFNRFKRKCELAFVYREYHGRYATIKFALPGAKQKFTWKQIFVGSIEPKLIGTVNLREGEKQIYDVEIGDKVILTAPRSDFAYQFLAKGSVGYKYLTGQDEDLDILNIDSFWQNPDYHYELNAENQKKLIEVLRKKGALEQFMEELGADNEEDIFARRYFSGRFTSEEIAKALLIVDEDLSREITELYSEMLESDYWDNYYREIDEAFLKYASSQLSTKVSSVNINKKEYYRFEYDNWMSEFRYENEYKNNSDFIEEILSGLSGSHLLRIYSFDASVDRQEFNEELSKLLENELKNN